MTPSIFVEDMCVTLTTKIEGGDNHVGGLSPVEIVPVEKGKGGLYEGLPEGRKERRKEEEYFKEGRLFDGKEEGRNTMYAKEGRKEGWKEGRKEMKEGRKEGWGGCEMMEGRG